MKRCPECRRDYYDDTLLYCLEDGNALVQGSVPSPDEPATGSVSEPGAVATGFPSDEPQTAILHSTAAPGESPTRAQIHTTDQTAIFPHGAEAEPQGSLGDSSERQSLSAHRAAKPQGSSLSNRRVKPLIAAAVAIVILIGAFFGYRYFNSADSGQINSIAVLPFVNASGDQETDFLSDGIAETLINNFTKIPALRVTARSTAFRFKGKEAEPQAVGRELNVGAILTGKVLLRGDSISIQVDLIDVSDGAQIWGNRYSGRASEILDLQQNIARDVSEQLKLKLSGAQEQQLTKTYTVNPEAYQLYLKGRFYWNKRGAENLKKAIVEFRAAADKDPNYALAYVGLADCYVLLENYAGTPASEVLPLAKSFANRALAIDDSLAEAHVSLAYIHDQLWEWSEAEPEFKRAIAMNPNYPTAHHWYSLYLNDVGRTDDAANAIRRAQELDPVSSIISQNVTVLHIKRKDHKSAIENGRKMIELDPDFANTHTYLGHAYLIQGSNAEAIAAMERGVELSGRSALNLGDLGYGYAVTGNRANASAIIKELEEKYARNEGIGQYLAAVYAGLGHKDEAFAWLEKDFQARSGQLAKTRWRPAFESLRSDARFADLLRRMNLPE